MPGGYIYLLLTEFEGLTVNYSPSFPASIYSRDASPWYGPQIEGVKRGAVIYSMPRENEVSKTFTTFLNCTKMKTFQVKW